MSGRPIRKDRRSVRAPPNGIHKLGAMSTRIGTDIYIPLKGERGRIVITAKALFKRMFEGDDQIGTRDLGTLKRQLPHGDPRKHDIAQTVRIQKLLQSRKVAVEYDRTPGAQGLETTSLDPELANEVHAWFDKHWDDLVFLTEVEDEGLDETPIFPITGF